MARIQSIFATRWDVCTTRHRRRGRSDPKDFEPESVAEQASPGAEQAEVGASKRDVGASKRDVGAGKATVCGCKRDAVGCQPESGGLQPTPGEEQLEVDEVQHAAGGC
jgi:hypothetical protein